MTYKTISLQTTQDSVKISMPYHPFCSKIFQELCGKWQKPHWVFPLKMKNTIQETLLKHFGENGEDIPERRTVKIKGALDPYYIIDSRFNVCFLGQVIANLYLKDPKKLDEGKLKINPNAQFYGIKLKDEMSDFEKLVSLTRAPALILKNVPQFLVEDFENSLKTEDFGISLIVE